MKKAKKRDLMDAVACANFMQKFKTLIWEKIQGNFISEKDLDDIAMQMFDYAKYPDYRVK